MLRDLRTPSTLTCSSFEPEGAAEQNFWYVVPCLRVGLRELSSLRRCWPSCRI